MPRSFSDLSPRLIGLLSGNNNGDKSPAISPRGAVKSASTTHIDMNKYKIYLYMFYF